MKLYLLYQILMLIFMTLQITLKIWDVKMLYF